MSAEPTPTAAAERQLADTILSLARPEILELTPYESARSLVPEGQARLFLDANEAPRSVVADPPGLNRYPDPQPRALGRALAEVYGVAPEQLLMTRGADEAIDLVLRVFCRPGRERILICPPTYGFYAITAAIQSLGVTEVPYRRDGTRWQLDTPAIVDAVRLAAESNPGDAVDEAAGDPRHDGPIKLIFLCSPNNPTGHSLGRAELSSLCRTLAGRAIVVLDEAYVEFCAQGSQVSLLAEHPNLVILRTLSKAWGLAGVRFGTTLAHPALIGLLARVCPPYPLGLPTVSVVSRALQAEGLERLQATIREVRQERQRLAAALAEIDGVAEIFESDGNFLLVRVDELGSFMQRCSAAGVVLRDRSSQHGLTACVRISVGSPTENQRLLAALEEPAR